MISVDTPTNACGMGDGRKRLSGRMKEVVMLAIVGAAVGKGGKQMMREGLEMRKEERVEKACSSGVIE